MVTSRPVGPLRRGDGGWILIERVNRRTGGACDQVEAYMRIEGEGRRHGSGVGERVLLSMICDTATRLSPTPSHNCVAVISQSNSGGDSSLSTQTSNVKFSLSWAAQDSRLHTADGPSVHRLMGPTLPSSDPQSPSASVHNMQGRRHVHAVLRLLYHVACIRGVDCALLRGVKRCNAVVGRRCSNELQPQRLCGAAVKQRSGQTAMIRTRGGTGYMACTGRMQVGGRRAGETASLGAMYQPVYPYRHNRLRSWIRRCLPHDCRLYSGVPPVVLSVLLIGPPSTTS